MEKDGDDVIDLGEYRRRRPESRRRAFAVWGGDGERSRFALPIWRAIYLVGGDRGALVWVEEGVDPDAGLNPFFVLDLADETPRTTFRPDLLGEVRAAEDGGPVLSESLPGGVAVFLGMHGARRWFLVVDDGGLPRQAMDPTARNDLLFLAGECRGLLLHRGLDEVPSGGDGTTLSWRADDLGGDLEDADDGEEDDREEDGDWEDEEDWPGEKDDQDGGDQDDDEGGDPPGNLKVDDGGGDDDPDPPPSGGERHLRSI